MNVNNQAFGGFVVSKKILMGVPIRYSFREESAIPQLNGWNLYSIQDDDEYVNHSENFVVVSAQTLFGIAPVMEEIFDAPYGTDLCWLYEQNVHTGFYDLTSDKEVTIEEIVQGN